MESFNAIPIFVEVIQSGGFSPAAKVLGLSKSAVSKRITQLEDQLGVRLLYRTTRKLSLTEAGERYYEYALKANQAAKEAEDAVTQLQGEPQGTLRINTPMSFGILHVAPLIPEFLLRYPKINIDMVMDDESVDMIDKGFDIAIRAKDLKDSNLIARKLAPVRSVVCAAPIYIERNGLPKTLADLSSHNCLLYSLSPTINEWHFNINGEDHSVSIKGNYQVNNSEALKEAVVKGLGIGRLPTFIANQYIKKGELVNVFPDYDMAQKTIYAIFPEREYMPAKVRVFLDFAVEYFGKDKPYWDS